MSEIEFSKHIFANSSTILRADYEHFMNNVKVYFKSGDVYVYFSVPLQVYEDFTKAESAGRYFHECILNKYEFMKLTTKIKKPTRTNRIEEAWEQGIPHEKKTEEFMKLLKQLDREEGYPADDTLECGGDGDAGETLMYLVDVLLREDKIDIIFNK